MTLEKSISIRLIEVDGEAVTVTVALPKLQLEALLPLLGSLGDFGSLLRRKLKVAAAASSSRSDSFKADREREFADLEARALRVFDAEIAGGSDRRRSLRAVASTLGLKVGMAEMIVRKHGRLSNAWKGQRIAHV